MTFTVAAGQVTEYISKGHVCFILLYVVSLTRSGISAILEKDYAEAIETINRAIAKAEK